MEKYLGISNTVDIKEHPSNSSVNDTFHIADEATFPGESLSVLLAIQVFIGCFTSVLGF